jgi:apolipoprotein N-acyltransferase
MQTKHLILLSILSGILIALAWQHWCSGLILFIAFLPILWIEREFYLSRSPKKKFFWISYLCFFFFNLVATWWIYNSTAGGAIVAIIINAFLLNTVFYLFHIIHRKFGDRIGYKSLIIFFTAFEYFFLNAEMPWPWLNIGNGFAKDIQIIQWYEYTGTLGGTIWVLTSNVLILLLLFKFYYYKKIDKLLTYSILILTLLPILISLVIFHNYKETKNPYSIVLLQPNIDPYNEKFDGLSYEDQTQILFDLADSLSDETTDYIIGPETAIGNNVWIHLLDSHPTILSFKEFLTKYPGTKFISGFDLLQYYDDIKKITPTARKVQDDFWYDVYNSAMQIDTSSNIQYYHKSKLVVGVEMLPYPQHLKFLGSLALDLGGAVGSRGTQKERSNFSSIEDGNKIAPVICFESVFGEYVTQYIKNGASMIFIITNDGWWGNTPGYKQHLSFASLRAIETRRSIARSANTGSSAFINQKGEIIQKTPYWVRTAIKNEINANHKITFYVKHGDYLGKLAYLGTIIILILLFTYRFSLVKKFLTKITQ